MKFNIRGENFEVSKALMEYVEKKVSKLNRYFNETPDATANVKMMVFQGVQKVEVTIPMKDLILRAEEAHDDMYAAIDAVVDKLERQVRKFKTKVNRKSRQHEQNVKQGLRESIQYPSIDEEDDLNIVRKKRFSLKPMFIEDAVMQMDMLGHNFYVFTNAETYETDVVYRRKNGQYGLISTH